jgi:hypothetical protein
MLLGHLESIFVVLSLVISWNQPMVVLRRVGLVWWDFGLILHFFWALICLVVGLLLWACVEWYSFFVLLCIFSPFMCVSITALLQMFKHQNLWKVLVLKPYF